MGQTHSRVAVDCDGSATTDFDNQDGTSANDQTLTYSWDFGDGNGGPGVSPSHMYSTVGTYTVSLTVSDGTATDIATTTVDVTEEPEVTTMHVSDLDATSTNQGNRWTAIVISRRIRLKCVIQNERFPPSTD